MPTKSNPSDKKIVLNLGCGIAKMIVEQFLTEDWEEIRVDADPEIKPDVVADITDLPFEDESADGIHCMQVLEHIPEGDLAKVLNEMWRVLRMGGELVLVVPDLMAASRAIVAGDITTVIYEAPSGLVRPLDIVYGFAPIVPAKPLYTHRTGFTSQTLSTWLSHAGFDGPLTQAGEWDLLAHVHKIEKEKSLDVNTRLITGYDRKT